MSQFESPSETRTQTRTVAVSEGGYEKQTPQLETPWTSEMGPDNAHPEYPRPQLVRPEWANLNGVWQFAEASEGESPPVGRNLDERILVPYPVESGLSGIKRHETWMWYRRRFSIPAEWNVGPADDTGRLLLHLERVDWEATVYINGTKVTTHQGGYDHFEADITDALIEGGPQELIVGVFDPTGANTEPVGAQPKGRQGVGHGIQGDGTLWLTSVSGIWGTVWLEPVPDIAIAGLDMMPDTDDETLRLSVETTGTGDTTVEATAFEASTEAGTVSGPPDEELELPIEGPRLWSPADPFLYDLEVRLLDDDGAVVDTIESYFGMRSLGIQRLDETARPTLNGELCFHLGSLESGYWPDGLYTAPTDDAIVTHLQYQKDLGYNMVRKHCKLETRRWFYHADRLGMLVWQDIPNREHELPDMDHHPLVRTAEARERFKTEVRQMVTKHDTHPSLAVWTAFNESWGVDNDNDFIREITRFISNLDPERYVNANSGYLVGGNTDSGSGDLKDMHQYPGPNAPESEPDRFTANGEYSTPSRKLSEHTWGACEGDASAEKFVSEYLDSVEKLREHATERGLGGSVYTATTDLENVCNGHITYDRKVIKAAAAEDGIERIREVHEDLLRTVSGLADR